MGMGREGPCKGHVATSTSFFLRFVSPFSLSLSLSFSAPFLGYAKPVGFLTLAEDAFRPWRDTRAV